MARIASDRATRRAGRAAAVALLLAGCGRGAGEAPPEAGIAIAFEEVEMAEAFFREGEARVADAEGGPGLWAALDGLPRPERGRLRRLDADAPAITVSLFRTGAGPIRLSADAGALIGLGPGETARVSLTALRREPRLIEP